MDVIFKAAIALIAMAFSYNISSLQIRRLAGIVENLKVEGVSGTAGALCFEIRNKRKQFVPSNDPRLDPYKEVHNQVSKSVMKVIAVYESDNIVSMVQSTAFAVSLKEAWTANHSVRAFRGNLPLARVHYTFEPTDCVTAPSYDCLYSTLEEYHKLSLSQLPTLEVVGSKNMETLRTLYLTADETKSAVCMKWKQGHGGSGFDFAVLRAPDPVFSHHLIRAPHAPEIGEPIFVQGFPSGVSATLVFDYIKRGDLRAQYAHRQIDEDDENDDNLEAFLNDLSRKELTTTFRDFRALFVAAGTVLAVDPKGLIATSTTTCSGFSGGVCYNTDGHFSAIHLGGLGQKVSKIHNVALSAFHPMLDSMYRDLHSVA